MKLFQAPVISTWVAAACVAATTFSFSLAAPAALASDKEEKPIIGINLDVSSDGKEYSIASRYVDAVSKAGGVALLVPPMSDSEFARVLPKLDGMLMIGGADYPPDSYGQKTEAKTCLMAKSRSDFDMLVVRSVLAQPPMPYLGICAGSQVLNIGSGGELIQDIPTAKPESKVSHSAKTGWQGSAAGSHLVTLKEGSRLAKIYGNKTLNFAVPTSHHQCVSVLGKNLAVAASTDDGVTEAVEIPGDRFVIGVQWHPERDLERNSVLFDELVKEAARYHAAKAK